MIQKIDDKYHGHFQILTDPQYAPNFSEFLPTIQIGVLVSAIGRDPANVVRPAAGDGKHLQHVPDRLFKLRHKLFGCEFLVGIPADLPGDEYHLAWRRFNAVGISDRRRPTVRKENPARHQSAPTFLDDLRHRLSARVPDRKPRRW